MARHRQTRRRASLPLAPHVAAALQRVRKAFSILNSIPLLDDFSDEDKMQMFCAAARDLYQKTIHFAYALQTSVEEENQPPSTTIED